MKKIESLLDILEKMTLVLTPNQKRRSLIIFIFMGMGALVELLGVTTILPFLEAMLDPIAIREKWYIQLILKIVYIESNKSLLFFLGIVIMLIYILKNCFMLLVVYMQGEYSSRIQHELSTTILSAYMRRPYIYFTENNSADIIRGINSDVAGVYTIILNAFTITSECLSALLIAVFLFITDFELAFGLILVAGVCLVLILSIVKKPMKKMGVEQRNANAACHKYAYQAINGIKEITVLQRRSFFVDIFKKSSNVRRKTILNYTFITAMPDRIIEGLCVAGFMIILCYRVLNDNDITHIIPQLGTFAVAAFKILPCVSKISSRISSIIYYRPTLNGVYDVLNGYNGEIVIEKEKNSENLNSTFEKIEVKDIVWKYPRSERNILDNISFSINKGEAIALIGVSGAGKTTLADILLGLFKPQNGDVLIDGHSIYEKIEEWSRMVGYVPQSTFLIDDTIKNNVAFGKENIDEEKIWDALELAQLKEFVKSLPQGIETVVGERGVRFSGGQQQRIAIARAMYHDPEILVLDEATSALDIETETAIMKSIDDLRGKKTLIIIAHRLSTIKKCDKIYEIKEGQAFWRESVL